MAVSSFVRSRYVILATKFIEIKYYFDGNVASTENVTEKVSKVWQFFDRSDDEVQPDWTGPQSQ
jgi:hypothetical protein